MKISVVIPLYNKENSILHALHSIFEQTLKPYEIIVINDGSTDGSGAVVAELKHPLLRLICQANGGVSAARNRGIEEAKGDWVAFLDADDDWLPEYLETITRLNKKLSDCNLIATAYYMKSYQGVCKPVTLRKLQFEGDFGILNNYFQVASHSHPPINSSSVVIRKACIMQMAGFPIGIGSGEDLLTWAKLALNNRIAYSRIPLTIFHLGELDEKSRRNRRASQEDKVGPELVKLLSTAPPHLLKDLKKYISHWFRMKASGSLNANNIRQLWYYSIKSLTYNPFNFRVYEFLILSFLPNCLKRNILNKYNV